MAENLQQQHQQCPPPPSVAPRYLLVVPKAVTNFKSLGIGFVPSHESCSNASRSIGAKISSLPSGYEGNDEHHNNIHANYPIGAWMKQYKMKVGDVLFKVNNEIVRTRSYSSIIDKINTLFEAQCAKEGTYPEVNSEGITLIFERDEQKFQKTNNEVQQSITHHDSPQDVGGASKMSISMDLSREHNVLHCIFSDTDSRKRQDEDDVTNCHRDLIVDSSSYSSDGSSQLVFPFGHNASSSSHQPNEKSDAMDNDGVEDFSNTNDSIGYNLSAIPEGVESEMSKESLNEAEDPTAQHPHNYRALNSHTSSMQRSTLPTTIYKARHNNSIVSNDFSRSMDSPSFSYSDSECMSPVGDKIPNDSADLSNNSAKNRDLFITQTRAQGLLQHSRQTPEHHVHAGKSNHKHLLEHRSSYFSPESDQPTNASKYDYYKSHNSSQKLNDVTNKYMANISTPLNHHLRKQHYFQSPVSEIQPTSSLGSCSVSTVYLSPFSNLPISSSKNATQISPGSYQQETSRSSYFCFRDIPIHMLDYNYVRNCTSKVELEKIVNALNASTDGEYQQFPSLLRLAKQKLNDVKLSYWNTDEVNTERRQSDVNTLKRASDQANDIPSHIHVEIQTSLEESKGGEIGLGSRTLSTTRNHDESDLVENMNSIVIAHAELQDKMESILDERDSVQERLKNEIIILKEKLQSVEHGCDRLKKENIQNIQILKDSKVQAEEECRKLRNTVVSSSKEAKHIMDRLANVQKEVKDLKAMLVSEKKSKRAELEEANAIKSRLEKQVANLSRQVELHEEDDKVTRELLELELRSEYQAASQIERARINELESCLSHTREELNHMYREHDALTAELNKAGKNSTTPSQFREILKEFAAAESCANALAKALTESESELSSVAMENKSLKKKNHKLQKRKMELAADNKELLLVLDAIDEKLQKSHEIIDNLHKELNKYRSKQNDCDILRSKWDDAKKVYQSKINELKLQLSNAEEMVPSTTYQQALDSAQVLRNTVKEKEMQIKELSERVQALEVKIKSPSNVSKGDAVKKKIGSLFPPSADLPLESSEKILLPIIRASNALEDDVFSPSLSKKSTSKLKHQRGSNKKAKNELKKRSPLTPIQGNQVDPLKALNKCTNGKENMHNIQVV